MNRVIGVKAQWNSQRTEYKHEAFVELELEGTDSVTMRIYTSDIPSLQSQFASPLGRHFYVEVSPKEVIIHFPDMREVAGNALAYCRVKDKYYNPATGEEVTLS